jgi:hypothetical protein
MVYNYGNSFTEPQKILYATTTVYLLKFSSGCKYAAQPLFAQNKF